MVMVQQENKFTIKPVKMCRLNKNQIKTKVNFINNYITSHNAADGSVFDANSNVTAKNIAGGILAGFRAVERGFHGGGVVER